MLRIYAERFVEASRLLATVVAAMKSVEKKDAKFKREDLAVTKFREHLERLRGECEQVECRLTIWSRMKTFSLARFESASTEWGHLFKQIGGRDWQRLLD